MQFWSFLNPNLDFIAAAVFHWLHYIAWSIKIIASLLKGTVSIILLSKINKDDVLSRAGKKIERFLLETAVFYM